ncbi:DUF3069 domain-containing protein [Shewanella eurypsychrophilus]|uniref:DUF3069 domain-containing protein n=1 Tax=Shewanella eurypsychrophilus TaxID=2593656 RepID=A0ABX6VB78_9GAMM|nr:MULTISPECIES: DUF3069 domain-containing protein [Shewanella]QFU24062.1 DUF3069 domain-containing protein [Shewanella sp. YLB-09]QPG59271.1 DUF3069 domain-containing protein [Shewanella eurypsychrophilus]
MIEITPEYKARVELVSLNVCNVVMPMDQIPENLLEAYANLCNELLEDSDEKFIKGWEAQPKSARALLPQTDFHGFYIANAWLQLSRVAQDISDAADSDEAIDEKEYNGIFTKISDESLKESIKKLKKARTDRALLNSIKAVIEGK